MPLLDHFHPPLSVRRHWHAFHNASATSISADVNSRLPPGYFAEPNVQFGIEIDVATFEEGTSPEFSAGAGNGWSPPAPTMTIPITLITDAVEVLVYNQDAGPVLAGAIELVSPANKDRPANRDAFVSKCASYLQQGVGLVIVDVVTGRGGDLHSALLQRLWTPGGSGGAASIWCGAYRPIERDRRAGLDIWFEALSVGSALPTVPLWLRGAVCLPVELDAAYARTCRELRIPEAA
jgi:hypothetical protein